MTTTPNMNMVLPTDHASTDTWGAVLNTALTLNDAHDHSAGKGVRITQAGINLTGDLSFAVHALTNALALDMTPSSTAAVAAYSSAVFTNSADNNLYFRNSTGTNVQITAGSALNIAGVSGFGGDYASVGALADFIDANDTYHFYQQLGGGVRQYARVAAADYDFYEFKANPTVGVPSNRVRLKSPAALATSYDMTWLTALPAGAQMLSVDNTGAISANSTSSGLVTGTDFRHTGSRTMPINYVGGSVSNAVAGGLQVVAIGVAWSWQSGVLPLRVGDIVTAIATFFHVKGAGTYTFTLFKNNTNATTTAIESWTNATSGADIQDSRTLVSPYTIVSGDRLHLAVVSGGAGGSDSINEAKVTWTR